MKFSFPLTARDREVGHRAESKLEIFFDLTLVVAFSMAATQFAHHAVEGHFFAAFSAFMLSMFGLVWAWSSYAWFSSAYEKNDFLYRSLTMMQMVGVVILTLGLPEAFQSLADGEKVQNSLMILGYVIMRVPLMIQWIRVSKGDARYHKAAFAQIKAIVALQVAWVVSIFVPLEGIIYHLVFSSLIAGELLVRIILDKKYPMKWQPDHIADRYGSLIIVALGECIFGLVAALRSLMDVSGWSLEVLVLGLSGVGIAFGLWRLYFAIPSGKLLEIFPKKATTWGYFHIFLFAAIVATGAGLDMVGYYLEKHTHLSSTQTVLTVALPIWILRGF